MTLPLVVIAIAGPVLLLLVVVIARRAASGAIPRNPRVGIRIRSTQASDLAWRAGHRAAVRPATIGFGASVVAVAIALPVAQLTASSALPLLGVVAVLVAAFLWLSWAADQAARAVDSGDEGDRERREPDGQHRAEQPGGAELRPRDDDAL